jgi:DNA-binding transcriptional LysR family regulator
MNWDDLKIFLSVARRKKLSDAAAELRIDITTVSRRIKRLEDDLGQRLFERLRTGHELTSYGETMVATAEGIERNVETLGREKNTHGYKPSGIIRISVAEGFGAEILSRLLGRFKVEFPEIEVDLVSGSGFLSLSKREADVAIGLSRSKSKHIQSDLLSPYFLHLYAHEAYLKSRPDIQSLHDLHQHTLIDYVDDLIYSEELRYFEECLPEHRPQIRSTSIIAQKTLVENGAGIAILPDFLVRGNLRQVLPSILAVERQFWFSSHQSVATLAKVRAFRNFTFKHLVPLSESG